MPELVLVAIIVAFIWWAVRHGEPGKGTHVGNGADGVFPWDESSPKAGRLYRWWADREYGLTNRGPEKRQDRGEL